MRIKPQQHFTKQSFHYTAGGSGQPQSGNASQSGAGHAPLSGRSPSNVRRFPAGLGSNGRSGEDWISDRVPAIHTDESCLWTALKPSGVPVYQGNDLSITQRTQACIASGRLAHARLYSRRGRRLRWCSSRRIWRGWFHECTSCGVCCRRRLWRAHRQRRPAARPPWCAAASCVCFASCPADRKSAHLVCKRLIDSGCQPSTH
jgi:hypothetical protein